jgi:hypothetical protein
MKPLAVTLLLDLGASAFWAWWTGRWWLGGVIFVMVAAYAVVRREVLEAWHYEMVQALVIGGFFVALMTRPT